MMEEDEITFEPCCDCCTRLGLTFCRLGSPAVVVVVGWSGEFGSVLAFLIFFSNPLSDAGSMLSFLFSGNGTRETATSLIRSRLISMSPLAIEVGVDRASAFRFFATPDPDPEYEELPPEMLSCLLPPPPPVSMTDVGAFTFEPTEDDDWFGPPADPGPELLLTLLLLLLEEEEEVLLVPNTESELTTIVSVKFEVVNLAMASLERRSLLEPE